MIRVYCAEKWFYTTRSDVRKNTFRYKDVVKSFATTNVSGRFLVVAMEKGMDIGKVASRDKMG
jgi:hypothetical protein